MRAKRHGLPRAARMVIEEVLHATKVHLRTICGDGRNVTVYEGLQDVAEGMEISIEKLRQLLKAGRGGGGRTRIVVSVAGGRVTSVMSSDPSATATIFDFDDRVSELADGELADEPNTGKAAEKAEREFHALTAGMGDAL